MGFTKIYQKLTLFLIFIYLAVFPFGQLLRFKIIAEEPISVLIPDLIIFCFIPIYFFSGIKKQRFHKILFSFFITAFFSSILSLFIFSISLSSFLIGFLYLVRLFAYFTFFVVVRSLIFNKIITQKLLFNSLILVTFFASIFGWIQYFWIPDLTSLKYLGWDDHLFRLVGTYFDPGFTGIIFNFGFLLVLNIYMSQKKVKFILLALFLMFSVLFTYSRATFLSLLVGTYFLFSIYEKKVLSFFFVLFFFFLVFLLPRSGGGEGIRLERVQSVKARLINYHQTLSIIKKSPLFGVGFNNICEIRVRMFGGSKYSHACYGADSSLLFVTATTGLVGLQVFLYIIFELGRQVRCDFYGKAFFSCLVSLLVHSFFVNSLFYPWVLGFMAILLSSTRPKSYLAY